jgi:hypothetical protein
MLRHAGEHEHDEQRAAGQQWRVVAHLARRGTGGVRCFGAIGIPGLSAPD